MKIGDKVLCLNASGDVPFLLNGIYTLSAVDFYKGNWNLVELKEFPGLKWPISRFKVIEQPALHSPTTSAYLSDTLPNVCQETFYGSSNHLIMPNTACTGSTDETTQDQTTGQSDPSSTDV